MMPADIDGFMRWAYAIELVGVFGIARSIFAGAMQMGEAKGWSWKETPAVTLGMSAGGIAWFMMLAAYFEFPEPLPWGQMGLPDSVRWVGFAASLVASGFLIWVFKTIGRAGSKQLVTFDNMKLVTEGPYSRIRHPMYTGFMLYGLASLLFTDHWGAGGAFLGLMLFVIVFRVPREEEVLIAKFGEPYREFIKRTGRFWPSRSTAPTDANAKTRTP